MPVLTAIDLDRHAKVRANIDLPGVPAGTKGKVLQKTGVTWIRYRVLFENGVEHGLLDGRHLVTPKEFVPVDERVEVGDAGRGRRRGRRWRSRPTEVADGGGAADNAFGVPAAPARTIEEARERLAAG